MSRRRKSVKLTWRESWPIWATFAGLFAFGGIGVWFFVPSVPRVHQVGPSEDVALSLSTLHLKTPVLFSALLSSGATVEFYVERESAEAITVAFSSCRRCYGSGHYIQAGQVFCRRCNQPMPKLGRAESPAMEKDCKHIPIPFEVTQGTVRVRSEAIRDSYTHWFVPILAQSPANGGSR